MSPATDNTATRTKYRGPNLGVLAAVYAVLKIASVFPVSSFGSKPPWFPGLNAPVDVVISYFTTHSGPVLLSAFLQVGAAIPFAIFAAAVLTRLDSAGATAAGAWIALAGGLMAAFDELTSGAVIWVMAQPIVARDGALIQALHHLSVALGGPGFTMPFGLLMAGVCFTAGSVKLLPKWLVAFGLALALVGELSWFSMIFPPAGFLIPLARWPGFVWLISAGFALSKEGNESRGQ